VKEKDTKEREKVRKMFLNQNEKKKEEKKDG